MDAIRVGVAFAVTLWGTAPPQAANGGAEPMQLAAVGRACTTEVRLGQVHAGPDGLTARAGGMHSELDEYLVLHAQVRGSIQRSAMLPGAEMRAEASRGEHPHE
jgi:hypothetical protein